MRDRERGGETERGEVERKGRDETEEKGRETRELERQKETEETRSPPPGKSREAGDVKTARGAPTWNKSLRALEQTVTCVLLRMMLGTAP